MSWKFKCSLCGKKANNKSQIDNHVKRHISGGKPAKAISRKEIQDDEDHSQAEFELQRRFGI